MPIFKIQPDGLVGLARVKAGPDLYEREIEDLLWSNLEAFVGEDLFPVARQPTIRTGGIPDVVALDATGRVVVIEVKRSIERTQLAQCLEYAGWARTANLDELARLYSGGVELFFAAWQDSDGDRIVHIDTEVEIELQSSPTAGTRSQPRQWKINGRRFEVGDLLEAGMIEVGEPLEWRRRDAEYHATVTEEGKLRLEDGRVFDTPSGAAMAASGSDAVPGWEVWRLPRRDDRYIIELRAEYFENLDPGSTPNADPPVEP